MLSMFFMYQMII